MDCCVGTNPSFQDRRNCRYSRNLRIYPSTWRVPGHKHSTCRNFDGAGPLLDQGDLSDDEGHSYHGNRRVCHRNGRDGRRPRKPPEGSESSDQTDHPPPSHNTINVHSHPTVVTASRTTCTANQAKTCVVDNRHAGTRLRRPSLK